MSAGDAGPGGDDLTVDAGDGGPEDVAPVAGDGGPGGDDLAVDAGDGGGGTGAAPAAGNEVVDDLQMDEDDETAVRGRRGPYTNVAIALGVLTALGLVVLAAAGFTPALYLLVIAVVGVLMIAVGARLR